MYQVLYRKYRPQVFSDVAGQEHITSTLANELSGGKLSHAYLFTGSRGTGKTTCARILAKAVNCLHPVNGNPCNTCEICKGIDNGSVLDITEIDAASNNGVDNIRDLREEANFTPAKAKFRVYIIDEVHMLSTGAFNALLKTLEEPPEYVMFILATTEVHKLPATILSRCQRFDFKRIDTQAITGRLEYVAEQEGLKLDAAAGVLIARLADGALRDALSILDQCASRSAEITTDIVTEVSGLMSKDYLFEMADAVRNKDCACALKMIDTLHNTSCDMERLCTELVNHFRNLMMVKTVTNPQTLIICTDEEMQRYRSQSEGFTLAQILYILNKLEETAGNLRRGMNRRIETEMVMVRLCSPELDDRPEAMLSRISELEAALSGGAALKGDKPAAEQTEKKPEITEPEPANLAQAKIENAPQSETKAISDNSSAPEGDMPFTRWAEVLTKLGERDMPLVGLLTGSVAVLRGEFLLINSANPTLDSFIKISSHRDALSDAVQKVTGKKYRLGIFKTNAGSSVQKKTDPLDDLMRRAKESDIPFDIE